MIQIEQIPAGSEQYPVDPILYRGSAAKEILVFSDFERAFGFQMLDHMTDQAFRLFTHYAEKFTDFTKVRAVCYYKLRFETICEFEIDGRISEYNDGKPLKFYSYEWKSKFDKDFTDKIRKFYRQYIGLLE